MSAMREGPKMVGEREAAWREREAYRSGFADAFTRLSRLIGPTDAAFLRMMQNDRYKLPKVTRPRVVMNGDREWKFEGDHFWERGRGTHLASYAWNRLAISGVSAVHARLLADLLANPTEECEDDS